MVSLVKEELNFNLILLFIKYFKVNAIDFQSHDKFANDPANKQAILSFLKNQWVDKKDLQIIIDESHKRHLKLEQLGIS